MKIYPGSALFGGIVTTAWAVLAGVSPAAEPMAEPPEPAVAEVTNDADPPATKADDQVYGVLTLRPLSITVPSYKLPRTRIEIMKLDLYTKLRFDFGWPLLGGAYVLTPGRLLQRTKHVAATVRVIDRNELLLTPSTSLAETLSTVPGFGFSDVGGGAALDRGLTLRGVSALVLRDGVPLNDPFDDTIHWTTLPREGLARAELASGAGATAWGNGALGGAVQFLTLPPRGKLVVETGPPPDGGPPDPKLTKQVIYGTGQLAATLGEFGTCSAEFVASEPASKGVLQVLGRVFSTDGFVAVAADRRGPVDVAAWSRHHWLEARWRQPFGKDQELVATVRGYDESGGNGTPYQQSSSNGTFASIAVAGNRTLGFAWNALVYAQSGNAKSHFSAVGTDRASEFPVLEQFALPTTAFGANWSGAWRHAGDSRTNAGVDIRSVRGESRENSGFTAGKFTRQRFAGGEQGFLGLFVLHDQAVTSVLRANVGTRIDVWEEMQGHFREVASATQTVLLENRYRSDHGTEFSPSLGAVWQPSRAWRWRVTGQQAFRRPTLGERYQTSGAASVVTMGNSALRTAHSTSIEVATEYSFFPQSSAGKKDDWSLLSAALPQKKPLLTVEAKAFLNEQRDGVGSVGLLRGSGDFPLLDTLPTGYRGEQRISLDRVRVQGGELSATWRPAAALTLESGVIWNAATIRHSARAAQLDGKRLPLVSRHTVHLNATWQVTEAASARLRVRAVGRRFADSENTLPLAETVLADFGATYLLN